MKDKIISLISWWGHNIKLGNTWIGILILILTYFIYSDKIILHQFLEKLLEDNRFIELILGLISGALIIHKPSQQQ